MRGVLRTIYFNVALTCVLLIGAEILGQVIFVLVKGYPVFASEEREFDEYYGNYAGLVELHPYLVAALRKNVSVQRGSTRFSTTDLRTRSTGTRPDRQNAITVAVLGGSTTFGSGVTDADTWPALLQDRLGNGYAVINYGLPGYSTVEAIIQMALLVPEVKPDVIVLYEGWNDIRNYHVRDLTADYRSHGLEQYDNVGIPIYHRRDLFYRLAHMSAVAKLAKVVSLRLFRESASTPVVDPAQVFDTPDPYVDRLYARNLRTLKALSEHLGAYAIFVPQVLNDHYYLKNQTSSRPDAGSVIANGVTVHLWTPRIANAAMPRLIHRFNEIMLTVCRPGDRQCTVLQDVEAAGWGPRDFIDAGHFSREGGHKLAEMTAKLITAHYADQQGSPGRTQRPARPAPKRSF